MTDASAPKPTPLLQTAAPRTWAAALGLGSLVFLAALLGILGRPMGFLSAIWPANALLLGLLLHRPDWLRPSSVLAVSVAYIAADLLTGSRLDVAILLSIANMAGVGAAWALGVAMAPITASERSGEPQRLSSSKVGQRKLAWASFTRNKGMTLPLWHTIPSVQLSLKRSIMLLSIQQEDCTIKSILLTNLKKSFAFVIKH